MLFLEHALHGPGASRVTGHPSNHIIQAEINARTGLD